MTTKRKVRVPRPSTIMRGIKTPEGFEREERTETWQWGAGSKPVTYPVLRLFSPDVEIEVHFSGGRDSYELASGHVTFDTAMGRRTFDRTGVEDSFYVNNPAKVTWVNEVDPIAEANEEIRRVIEERIPEARERLARSEAVPTIPFTVTPEVKQRITEELLAGRRHSFVPSGFGTGYTLTAHREPYSKPNAELALFFGVAEVWVSEFDAD